MSYLYYRMRTGCLGIDKAKEFGLRSVKVVAEGSGVVSDGVTRNDIRIVDRLKTVVLRMEE
jgi:hypothetical protein